MPRYPCPVSGKKDIYPSVTEIISDSTNNSAPLIQWSSNMTCQWIRENARLNADGYYYEVTEDQLNDARFHFREVSQKALDIGSEVHDAIEKYYLTGADIHPSCKEAENAFDAFLKWTKENNIKQLEIEKKVYSNNWAGTLDFYGYFNGKLYVIDWKSSKAHYPEMRYQVAAYRNAINKKMGNQAAHNLLDGQGGYTDVQWRTEYNRLRAIGCGVLRLDKETGLPDFKDHSKTYEADLKVFNAMVKLYYLRHPRIAKKFKEATK